MKTHIGNDQCTRCGGGSSPCAVCNPIEESKCQPKPRSKRSVTTPSQAQSASSHLIETGQADFANCLSKKTAEDDSMNPENTDTPLKADFNNRHLCECGSYMVMCRGGYPLCEKTALEYEARHRDRIIEKNTLTLAVCDCRLARRKNGSRVCTEPDYNTHMACPECGQPWTKFIFPNN